MTILFLSVLGKLPPLFDRNKTVFEILRKYMAMKSLLLTKVNNIGDGIC